MRRPALLLGVLLLLAGCGRPSRRPSACRSRPRPSPAEAAARAQLPSGRYLTARLISPTALRDRPGGRALHRLGVRTEFGSPPDPQRHGAARRLARRHRPGAQERAPGLDPRAPRAAGEHELLRSTSTAPPAASPCAAPAAGPRLPGRRRPPGDGDPTGRFAVTDKLHPDDPGSPYGCCALALSGHQTKLIDGWPGGDRLAIHATPNPRRSAGPRLWAACGRIRGTSGG